MYGESSEEPPLAWEWVEGQLVDGGVYWVVPSGSGPPHPRPVWGVWAESALHLSIGSPPIVAALASAPEVTVHLGGATDVVIIEGVVLGSSVDPEVVAAYDAKYDWDYQIEEYGPLTVIRPRKVMAWRSAGWAGRDGFRQTGRWRLPPSD